MKKILITAIVLLLSFGQVYAQSFYDTLSPAKKNNFHKYLKNYLINFTGLKSSDLKVFNKDYYNEYFENDAMTFVLAAINNEIDIMRSMLSKNKQYVNIKNFDGTSLLNIAVISKAYLSVEFLINNGANVNVADEDSYTPLILAASLGDVKMAKILISKGANINYVDIGGETALDRAIINNGKDSEIAKYLRSQGAKALTQ